MSKLAPSEFIVNDDNSVFHLHMLPNQLADIILLVGDQDRVTMIGGMMDSIESEGRNREFHHITGYYRNKRITALSTGIGTDNIDIVMNELDALANIDFQTREIKTEHRRLHILRVGTSGSIQDNVTLGSMVYSSICLGFDGLLNWYGLRELVSIPKCEEAFIKHMNWSPLLPRPYFVPRCQSMEDLFADVSHFRGITVSAPGFYGPQGRVLRLPLVDPDLKSKLMSFQYDGLMVTNFEMEGSAIAGLSRLLGHDYGTLCLIIAQRAQQDMNVDYKALMKDCLKKTLDVLSQSNW